MRAANSIAVLLAAPFLAVMAAALYIVAAEGSGRAPMSNPRPANPAEAALLGDAAVVLRDIRQGQSPNDFHVVRRGIDSATGVYLTTTEAAVWSRQLSMVIMLDRESAIPADGSRRELACLAVDVDAPEIVRYLDVPVSDCEPGEARARILQRR